MHKGIKCIKTAPPLRKLIFSDEFDGNELDLTKWNRQVLQPYAVNNEWQYYTDRTDNSFVENGH